MSRLRQAPFDGPARVLAYLGRHNHRVAISNDRLVDIEDGRVGFRRKDYHRQHRSKPLTLPADTLIRRFLVQVLPPDSPCIRHNCFLAKCHRRETLARGGRSLDIPEPKLVAAPLTNSRDRFETLTVESLRRCPVCRLGSVTLVETFGPPSSAPLSDYTS